MEVELIGVLELKPGDHILLHDPPQVVQFRGGMISDEGWMVLTVYMPDEVRQALLQPDARVARVLHT